MSFCLRCNKEFEPKDDEQLFCDGYCRGAFRTALWGMFKSLKRDVHVFEVYDLVQNLMKKEAEGI